MKTKTSVILEHSVDQLIRTIRGQRVILDADLARAYGTTTTRLNPQVNRNANRFPEDFAFQLTADRAVLKSHPNHRPRGISAAFCRKPLRRFQTLERPCTADEFAGLMLQIARSKNQPSYHPGFAFVQSGHNHMKTKTSLVPRQTVEDLIQRHLRPTRRFGCRPGTGV